VKCEFKTRTFRINIRDGQTGSRASLLASAPHQEGAIPLPLPSRSRTGALRGCASATVYHTPPQVATLGATAGAHATCDTARHDGPRRPEHPASRSTQISTQCCQLSATLPAPPTPTGPTPFCNH